MVHLGGGGKTPYGIDSKGDAIWDKPDYSKKEVKEVYDDALPF